jgi:hypothetical protein
MGPDAAKPKVQEGSEETTEEVVVSDWRFTAHRHARLGGRGGNGENQALLLLLEQELAIIQQEISFFETLLLEILTTGVHPVSPSA